MSADFMGRHRQNRHRTLPPNLYFYNGYYKYKRPDTGKFTTIGKDRTKAVSATNQLNGMLTIGRDLVEKVMDSTTRILLEEFVNRYESSIMPEQKLASETIRYYKSKFVHIRKHLGKKPIDEISVKDIADFLDKFPPKTSNKYRRCLSLIFKHAIAKGLCHDNPAEKTIACKIKRTRKRLSLAEYFAIYHHEETEPWLKNAMDIGLQTLQRRKDIVNMKFHDIKDDHLYVIQSKTEKHGEAAYLKMKIDEPLKKVIDRCRDNTLSPYLIHRKPDRQNKQNYKAKGKKHYTQITTEYLTKGFAAIRDKLAIFKDIPTEDRPTFHEIRALGIKLYEDQGVDAQALAGHKTRAMTDKYKEGHETKWTEVVAGLKINNC